METKELMIGDFVEYEYHITAIISLENNVITKEEKTYTRIIKVATVNPNHVDYIVKNAEGLDIYTAALKENLKPIPITPKILEKNGFKKELDDDSIHYRYTLITDGISFSLKYALSVFQWLGPLDFKYVHELQHALRLCGIGKEIEL